MVTIYLRHPCSTGLVVFEMNRQTSSAATGHRGGVGVEEGKKKGRVTVRVRVGVRVMVNPNSNPNPNLKVRIR